MAVRFGNGDDLTDVVRALSWIGVAYEPQSRSVGLRYRVQAALHGDR